MTAFALKGDARFLPDTLSGAIIACLEDLRIVEKEKGYHICMHTWHSLVISVGCCVCLGGARLARVVNNPHKNLEVFPDGDANLTPVMGDGVDLPVKERWKLNAMDAVRKGRPKRAVYDFYGQAERIGWRVPLKGDGRSIEKVFSLRENSEIAGWVHYERDADKFKEGVMDMASKLAEIGY